MELHSDLIAEMAYWQMVGPKRQGPGRGENEKEYFLCVSRHDIHTHPYPVPMKFSVGVCVGYQFLLLSLSLMTRMIVV